jgi:hypothetical protein
MARKQLEALGRYLANRLADQSPPSERIGDLVKQLSQMPANVASRPVKSRQAGRRSLAPARRRSILPRK